MNIIHSIVKENLIDTIITWNAKLETANELDLGTIQLELNEEFQHLTNRSVHCRIVKQSGKWFLCAYLPSHLVFGDYISVVEVNDITVESLSQAFDKLQAEVLNSLYIVGWDDKGVLHHIIMDIKEAGENKCLALLNTMLNGDHFDLRGLIEKNIEYIEKEANVQNLRLTSSGQYLWDKGETYESIVQSIANLDLFADKDSEDIDDQYFTYWFKPDWDEWNWVNGRVCITVEYTPGDEEAKLMFATESGRHKICTTTSKEDWSEYTIESDLAMMLGELILEITDGRLEDNLVSDILEEMKDADSDNSRSVEFCYDEPDYAWLSFCLDHMSILKDKAKKDSIYINRKANSISW